MRHGTRQWAPIFLTIVACCVAVPPTRAALCGADVGGVHVPCGCGDVVVSDLVLADDDPIVTGAPCGSDGLIVRAPDAARPLTIDLHGTRLRGTGGGVGIRVVAGGPGGALIVSSGAPAVIVGFADGIAARGTDTLGLVEDVVVVGSQRDGVRISGTEFQLRRVEVHDAARDGFSLGGRGFAVSDTRVVGAGRYGYFVMGHAAAIGFPGAGNVAERSGAAGFNLVGAGHQVTDCTAVFGARDGVHMQAASVDVHGCRATDNGGDGIDGLGSDWRLSGNEAVRNRGDGLRVRGVDLVDQGGNRGRDNGAAERARAAVQCTIGALACAGQDPS
jgi:hypothetical protein